MAKAKSRDIEKTYPLPRFIAKLRRLADTLESGRQFTITVAGERITVPADAVVNIEHERDGDQEEVEFQIKWKCQEARPKRRR
jgi:amphi-Trp domain-containing protein